jgi:hypothetical protein
MGATFKRILLSQYNYSELTVEVSILTNFPAGGGTEISDAAVWGKI